MKAAWHWVWKTPWGAEGQEEGFQPKDAKPGQSTRWESFREPGLGRLGWHADFLPQKGGLDGKASAYSVGDLGSIPRSGRSSGEGNGNPLQYSCLENPTDGGAW